MNVFLRKSITYLLLCILSLIAIVRDDFRSFSWLEIAISALLLLVLLFESARQLKKYFKLRRRLDLSKIR
ncbi:hypothetical protein Lbys_3579 [Leadbetterella byssophila DSM 17132]|uniref:Uncharacterized protein n=1 Tax=Leadbetterella byssophila (strain DSM 17132 / JCM 16389 / KACC 11308 / NBRC 106382 / 4M15) TaxID=649349 RepID=E4RZT5_LEAB4|nr:hypothetical protein Lbys_3579 [Leadbetterella byssophila DSM 17132]